MNSVVVVGPPVDWVRRVVALAWFTIAYNLVEGVVSIGMGVETESVALFGFGADSLIEVASAVLVLWRFKAEQGTGPAREEHRERRATMGIGLLFAGLALTTVAASVIQLATGARPQTTLPGLIISALSLGFMVSLWKAKTWAARALGSKTVAADASCSLACIRLSVTLFVGSLLSLVMPALWFADAVAALGLSLLMVLETRELVAAARSPTFVGGCGCHDEQCASVPDVTAKPRPPGLVSIRRPK